MNSKDQLTRESLSHLIVEKHQLDNGYVVLFTAQCPVETRKKLINLTSEQGENWFLPFQRDPEYYKSHRGIFIPYYQEWKGLEAPIIKRKVPVYQTTPAYKSEKMRSFTTRSLVQEIRTSLLLAQIIREANFQHQVTCAGKTWPIEYRVQQPWGALYHKDSQQHPHRYGIFEYIYQTSVRDEIYIAGGWNMLPPDKLELWGQVNQHLSTIAQLIMEKGMDPHDFGLIQLLYRFDEENSVLHLSILDTEQYLWTAWRNENNPPYHHSDETKILADNIFA